MGDSPLRIGGVSGTIPAQLAGCVGTGRQQRCAPFASESDGALAVHPGGDGSSADLVRRVEP